MCRSAAEGGRRCQGSRAGGSAPPADGKVRTEIHTNKRSYSVVGGESKVPWMPGERVVSMDVIPSSEGGQHYVPGPSSTGERAVLDEEGRTAGTLPMTEEAAAAMRADAEARRAARSK